MDVEIPKDVRVIDGIENFLIQLTNVKFAHRLAK